MTKIEFDYEAQKNLAVPLGKREIYPNAGAYMAEILKEHDVTFAFGVPGGHIWHFVDAITRIGIKTIIFAHEQNAVYAGEAYAQVTGKTAICFGTVGPGTGNSFSPMQQAWLSNTPIIYLAGGHENEHDGLFNTIQESYASEFFKHVTKYATRVFYPHAVKQFMVRGFKIAQAAPKGPVAFEMGLDLLLTKDDIREHYWGGFFQQHTEYVPKWRGEDTSQPLKNAADPEEVAKAAKLICEAKAPFMMIGDQAAWDKATVPVQEFVELTNMPFTTRRLGRAVVSEKHPNALRGMPPFRREIDLLITCGLKVGFFDGYAHYWPPTIQVSNCAEQVWAYIGTAATLMGSIDVCFKQLNDYIKANNMKMAPERAAWTSKCTESTKLAIEKRKAKAYKYGPDHPRYKSKNILHFGYMSQIIREVCDELYDSKVRVMIDGYTMSDFVMPYLQFTRPASCITSNDHAGVGHGVCQAIGAALGDMENNDLVPVLALMGDSGMMNGGPDMEVAIRYKLPIVYLITNNGGWMPGMKFPWYGPNWDNMGEQDVYGTMWNGIKQWGEERPREGIDFVKFAEALGGKGMRCDRSENFRDMLIKAFKMAETDGAIVLDCIMDQHLVNKAVVGPVYCLMYAHLPWDDLPPRGKSARKTYLSDWFPALKDEPELPAFDPWDPLTEEEIGNYEIRDEIFK